MLASLRNCIRYAKIKWTRQFFSLLCGEVFGFMPVKLSHFCSYHSRRRHHHHHRCRAAPHFLPIFFPTQRKSGNSKPSFDGENYFFPLSISCFMLPCLSFILVFFFLKGRTTVLGRKKKSVIFFVVPRSWKWHTAEHPHNARFSGWYGFHMEKRIIHTYMYINLFLKG